MQRTYTCSRVSPVRWILLIGLALALTILPARSADDIAMVVGLLGQGTATMDGQASRELRSGLRLPAGTVIKTGPHSAIDLDLGSVVGVVRLTEKSVLQLETLTHTAPGKEGQMDVQLRLIEGTLLGRSAKVPSTANFEVKIPSGVIGVDSGQYRIQAQGFLVVLDGTLVFGHVAQAGADPVSYALRGPPAVYFSPIEKVRPAPVALIKEVSTQLRAKVSKR